MKKNPFSPFRGAGFFGFNEKSIEKMPSEKYIKKFPSGHEKIIQDKENREGSEQGGLEFRLKKIEKIAKRLEQKYSSYNEFITFIHYVKATEKLFLQASYEKDGLEHYKKTLIENDIFNVASTLSIDSAILHDIYKEFQLAQIEGYSVHEIAEKLLQKYGECSECKAFIVYVRDIYATLFADPQENFLKERLSQEKIIQAKIRVLSYDGAPKQEDLETIYEEFCDELHV